MTFRSIKNASKFYSLVRKSKKYWKKSQQDPMKFTLQFRNDFVVNKIRKLFKSLKIELIVKGYDNLGNGPAILVGNHQDNIDGLALIYALKKQTEDKSEFNKIATFIAKHSLQYRGRTRYPLSVLDTFFLDRNDLKKSLETYNNFGKFIKENKTFGVIFPEGTRNKEKTVGEFKPGAFKIAKKELLSIIPFTINNSVGGFDQKRKEKLKIEVIFHKRISANSIVTQNTTAIADRVQKIVKSSFVEPQYSYSENDDEKDIETSKPAIKWHKKEAKKMEKEAKKERLEREHERKVIEAEEKEAIKYEKYKAKQEEKLKRKGKINDEQK